MHSIDTITPAISALFQPLEHHLAVISMLAGLTPGNLYVDDPQDPQAGLAWFHSRVYLAGQPGASAARQQDLAALLEWELLPQMRLAGMNGFILHGDSPAALDEVPAWFSSGRVIPAVRQSYTCTQLAANWRTKMPRDGDYRLHPVDEKLLSKSGMTGIDWLTEEMISERPSVDDFLEKSFGVCLVQDREIVGWCLSEYNCDGCCELGVAVAEQHQRRGLGTVMTLALVEEAFQRGLRRIGWHCWAKNVASGALALRSGFQLEQEYPVMLVLFETS